MAAPWLSAFALPSILCPYRDAPPPMDLSACVIPFGLLSASSLMGSVSRRKSYDDEQTKSASETIPTEMCGDRTNLNSREIGTSDDIDTLDPDPIRRYSQTVLASSMGTTTECTHLQGIQQSLTPSKLPHPAEEVKGMYRLLDLISESGSNGYVDKVVIAQDSLQRFINALSPGAYASITRVDFKTLDRLMIKPLGVYGSKDQIVRLLQSIGAVDDNGARSLLGPIDVGGSKPSLASGLYIVKANVTMDISDERHYVIYWPEDSTWNDSATSSVRRNRVTFMRYLTKMCDQVVALLSPEHSASIIWNDEDNDSKPVDTDVGDTDRLFTFEVAKTNEQEENAIASPGFQMHFHHISHNTTPPDLPVDPAALLPRLLPGETAQGFLTGSYIPQKTHTEEFRSKRFSEMALKQLLKDNALVLSENLDENAIQILLHLHLAHVFPELCSEWQSLKQDISDILSRERIKRELAGLEKLASEENTLRCVLHDTVIQDVMALFPSLERDRISSCVPSHTNPSVGQEIANSICLADFEALYPEFSNTYQKFFQGARFDIALRRNGDFETWKLRLVSVQHLKKHQRLRPERRADLIQSLLQGDFDHAQRLLSDDKKSATVFRFVFSSFLPSPSGAVSLKKEMKAFAAQLTDSRFLSQLKSIDDRELLPIIQHIEIIAYSQLSSLIDGTVESMIHEMAAMQQGHFRDAIQDELRTEEVKLQNEARVELIRELNAQSARQQDSVVHLNGVATKPLDGWGNHYAWNGHSHPYRSREYWIAGHRQALKGQRLEFRVHLMALTTDDRHNMQLNPKHTPSPSVNDRSSSCFHLSIGNDIAFCQIVENEKLLLILIDRDRVFIYLDRLLEISTTIRRRQPIKRLNLEKLGQDVLFAFDETKRALAVCASKKLRLHLFVFDETFKTLQGQGSAINLDPWYSQAGVSILHMAFVSGKEEVVLVDSSSRARIFNFITLQFRPASLPLPSPPNAIFSSPDGSCFLVLHTQGTVPSITAYHWQTFGSTQGIPLDVPDFSLHGAVLTSMVNRGCIFFVGLDINTGHVRSIAIDITNRATEYIFKKKGNRNTPNNEERLTLHNSLLDCHTEVWTRFPVLPAVRRRTVTSLSERQRKSFTFITEDPTRPYGSYFSDLIQSFERTARKPIGEELYRIGVSATRFESFQGDVVLHPEWNISRYRLGEWLVDLLCLIPIHIAVCRENRFMPLADGVLSPDLERSLLGAEVNTIVDKLSFGWYESIFQSYLATKPVKVVSSMGQQSVGKSFTLNHLLDTSFAGSAMRTTEGVWMSVTPTDDTLIVALDFEGVDSVERSLQEDTLLVLFNTAISNLVLFRNNFAFSRDISGLFQSFQSSASVLDPAANPSLFQSTLVIIIKDVVDSDKIEITDE